VAFYLLAFGVAVWMLLVSTEAKAQAITPETTAERPPCWAKIVGGSGEGFVWGGNVVDGQYAGWWCELPGEPRGQWRKVGVISLHGYVLKHPANVVFKTPAEMAAAYWDLNVAAMTTAGSPPAQWILKEAMYAALDATKPAPPPAQTWVVQTALSGSRPLYSVVNGALVSTTQRTPALASPPTMCDCSAKTVIGTSTYCPTTTSAPLVALCRVR
jgi:hypothetical protein